MENIALNNRYQLLKSIGEGGFARVYLATDLLLGRKVAVKVLDASWTKDEDVLKRFRMEARAAAGLEHPHILGVYDFGVANKTPYLGMPYIDGGTLAERMKQEQLTLDEIGVYLEQVTSALDYAHSKGIIHRDVKPSNLLIRGNGQLVLMDFGLAKVLEQAAMATDTGVFGTVAYMAPEQFHGMVCPASDQYMLGVILYQMLAGKLPYEGNTNQVLLAHVHLTPATLVGLSSMKAVHPRVVQALDEVIRRVLAKQPEERYSSCQALSAAYYKALQADPRCAAVRSSREAKQDIRHLEGTIIDPVEKVRPPSGEASPPALPKIISPNLDATLIAPSPPQPRSPAGVSAGQENRTPVKRLVRPARLVVTTEPDKGFHATFDLTGETITIGRARDNTLYLPLQTISRYHAVLQRVGDGMYKIAQLKTVNPLRLHGEEVSEKVLEDGDTFEIGKRGYAEYIVKFTYQAPEYSA